MSTERIIFIVLRIATAGMLVWALARHPIGYYTILRLVVCAVCAYGIYLAIRWKQQGWAFPFGALILLFQPLTNLRVTRQTWNYVDVAVAAFLVLTIFFLKPTKDNFHT
jgi:low affinity Fe/Cu permease